MARSQRAIRFCLLAGSEKPSVSRAVVALRPLAGLPVDAEGRNDPDVPPAVTSRQQPRWSHFSKVRSASLMYSSAFCPCFCRSDGVFENRVGH